MERRIPFENVPYPTLGGPLEGTASIAVYYQPDEEKAAEAAAERIGTIFPELAQHLEVELKPFSFPTTFKNLILTIEQHAANRGLVFVSLAFKEERETNHTVSRPQNELYFDADGKLFLDQINQSEASPFCALHQAIATKQWDEEKAAALRKDASEQGMIPWDWPDHISALARIQSFLVNADFYFEDSKPIDLDARVQNLPKHAWEQAVFCLFPIFPTITREGAISILDENSSLDLTDEAFDLAKSLVDLKTGSRIYFFLSNHEFIVHGIECYQLFFTIKDCHISCFDTSMPDVSIVMEGDTKLELHQTSSEMIIESKGAGNSLRAEGATFDSLQIASEGGEFSLDLQNTDISNDLTIREDFGAPSTLTNLTLIGVTVGGSFGMTLAKLGAAPKIFRSTFDQITGFSERMKFWPKPVLDGDRDDLQNYAELKRLMDTHSIRDFDYPLRVRHQQARLLQAQRDRDLWGDGLPLWFYNQLNGLGESWLRPLWWLLAVFIFFMGGYVIAQECFGWEPSYEGADGSLTEALRLSIVGTFLFSPSPSLSSAPWGLMLSVAMQKIISTALLAASALVISARVRLR